MLGLSWANLGFFLAIIGGTALGRLLRRFGFFGNAEWFRLLASSTGGTAVPGQGVDGERDGLKYSIRYSGGLSPHWSIWLPGVGGPQFTATNPAEAAAIPAAPEVQQRAAALLVPREAPGRVEWIQSRDGLVAQLNTAGVVDWHGCVAKLLGDIVALAKLLPPGQAPAGARHPFEAPSDLKAILTSVIILAPIVLADAASALLAVGQHSVRDNDTELVLGVGALAVLGWYLLVRPYRATPAHRRRGNLLVVAALAGMVIARLVSLPLSLATEGAPEKVQTEVSTSGPAPVGVLELWVVALGTGDRILVEPEFGSKFQRGRPVNATLARGALGRVRALELTPQ
jgi:hypothetical protein